MGAQNTRFRAGPRLFLKSRHKAPPKYRVGIVSAGPKVIYTFLNPEGWLRLHAIISGTPSPYAAVSAPPRWTDEAESLRIRH